jgi:hypothetical protein
MAKGSVTLPLLICEGAEDTLWLRQAFPAIGRKWADLK